MIDGVIIKNLNKNIDERGWLAEIFRNDNINFCPAMSYISVTKQGIIRGPHEHKYQSDFFVFAGPGDFELHLWDNRDDCSTKGEYLKIVVGQNNPTTVIIPPGVVHGYKCVSGLEAWCINLPDKLYKGKNKSNEIDEIRWEEKESSLYKIA